MPILVVLYNKRREWSMGRGDAAFAALLLHSFIQWMMMFRVWLTNKQRKGKEKDRLKLTEKVRSLVDHFINAVLFFSLFLLFGAISFIINHKGKRKIVLHICQWLIKYNKLPLHFIFSKISALICCPRHPLILLSRLSDAKLIFLLSTHQINYYSF